MKKNSQVPYREQLLELGKLYKIQELKLYAKTKKDLTISQIELILLKNKTVGTGRPKNNDTRQQNLEEGRCNFFLVDTIECRLERTSITGKNSARVKISD